MSLVSDLMARLSDIVRLSHVALCFIQAERIRNIMILRAKRQLKSVGKGNVLNRANSRGTEGGRIARCVG